MPRVVTGVFRRLAQCFVAGLVAMLPLALTVGVIAWVAGFVAGFLGPDTWIGYGLRSLGVRFATDPRVAYGIGVALVFAVIFLVGIAVEAGAKTWIQVILDALLRRIPIIGSVYGTSRQLVGLVDKNESADLKGMQAVFWSFGERGGAGILALLVSSQRFRINGQEYQIIIVPTAPVPVGGGMFFVPADSLQPTDVSVEGLMSIYVSMGISAPQFLTAVESKSAS